MKKLILAVALLTLSAPVFAESAISGGIADFDIKTDEIKVWTSGSVANGCQLNPQALENTAEVELRRLGFKIAGANSASRVLFRISASRFSSKDPGGQNGCSAMLSVELFKIVDTTPAHSIGKTSSRLEPIWSTRGLFTTAKNDMTEQMQAVVRDHVNELYLDLIGSQ